jgi:transcriptional regulator with XRE-family HTH domain
MDWTDIRTYYAELFAAARAAGVTQKEIADRGGLSGQNLISRMLANDKDGPTVETLIKAIEGLGISVAEFFAELERRVPPVVVASSPTRPTAGPSTPSREPVHYGVADPFSPQELTSLFAQFIRELQGLAPHVARRGTVSVPAPGDCPPAHRQPRKIS